MKKIGITGAIGAGKSFAAALLRERGFDVLDADAAVHALYRDSTALRAEMAETFGPECLVEGGVTRRFFVERVFVDKAIREKLETVVYPHLTGTVRAFFEGGAGVERPAASPERPRFLEAALLSRAPGIIALLDEVWIVDAPEELRLRRLVGRGLAEDDARRRIQDQRGACDESLFAGKTIRKLSNTGDAASLLKQFDEIL